MTSAGRSNASKCRCADRDAEACAFVAGAETCSCACHAPASTTPRPPRVEPWQRITYVHECAAAECREVVPLDRLMCGACWKAVPRELQAAVWKAYRPGQEVTGKISRDYALAYRAAVDAVAKVRREERERVDARARQGRLFG